MASLRQTIGYSFLDMDIKEISESTYTLSTNDYKRILWFTDADEVTVYLPDSASLAIRDGFRCAVVQGSTGSVTVEGLGDASLVTSSSSLSTNTSGDGFSITKALGESWLVEKAGSSSSGWSTYSYISKYSGLEDEAALLQEFIDSVPPFSNIEVHADTNRPIYLSQQVQVETSHVSISFHCPVLCGGDFRFRLLGRESEKNLTEILASDSAEGSNTLQIANSSNLSEFPVGSKIVVRGKRDIDTFYPLPGMKNTYTIVGHTAPDILQLDSPIETDGSSGYQVDYGQAGFEEKWGDPNYTRIYPLISMQLDSDVKRGSVLLNMDSSNPSLLDFFEVGDLIRISDTESPQDYSAYYSSSGSLIHNEMNRIVSIDRDALTVTLEKALEYSYKTSFTADITKVSPIENSVVKGMSCFWAERTLTKTNAIEMAFAYNSHILDCETLGFNGFSWHRHAMRMSDSYQCSIDGFNISHAAYSSGGEGYGAVTYGATDCRISNGEVTATRHSVLLARASSQVVTDNVVSRDCYISDFDVHGNNSANCDFIDCDAYWGLTHGANQEFILNEFEDLGGGSARLTLDESRFTELALSSENQIRIRGTAFLPPAYGESDGSTATLYFPQGHLFEVGDEVSIYGSLAIAYNGVFTLSGVTSNSITYSIVGASYTPDHLTWKYSPQAVVYCDAKSIDGYYDVTGSSTSPLTVDIDVSGVTVPASVNITNAWITVPEGFTKAAFRTGNPTHFFGDRDIRFKGVRAFGYDPTEYAGTPYVASNALVFDPQPGCHNISFNGESIDSLILSSPQRNSKEFTVNRPLTSIESSGNDITLVVDNSDNFLRVGHYLELDGTDSHDGGPYKVTGVVGDTITLFSLAVGTVASSSNGEVSVVHPYYELSIDNILLSGAVRRTKPETAMQESVYLEGEDEQLISRYRIQDLHFENTNGTVYANKVHGIEVSGLSFKFKPVLESHKIPSMEDAYDSGLAVLTTAYGVHIRNSNNIHVHGNNFNEAPRGVKITNCVNGVIENNDFKGIKTQYVLDDSGGNTGTLFIGRVKGVTSPAVSGEGTSAMKIVFEDVDRIPLVVSTDLTLGHQHNGRVLRVTAEATITVPSGLMDGFSCAVMKDTPDTVDFDMSAVTVKGDTVIVNQNSWASLEYITADTYSLVGDLEAP